MFGRRRGQFFSFDVIAGAFIFLIAFFLLAFYWLNAQALFAQQESGDMQREAERVADQLMVGSRTGTDIITPLVNLDAMYNGQGIPPDYKEDNVYPMPVASFGDGRGGLNQYALSHFLTMSNDYNHRFYNDTKEKLGIPRYEYYITIEGTDGHYLNTCIELVAIINGGAYGRGCFAGIEPGFGGAKQVANAERIVVFEDYVKAGSGIGPSGTRYPAKLRVQVWQ